MKEIKIYNNLSSFKLLVFSLVFIVFFISCNDSHGDVTHKEIVQKPEEINGKAEDLIQGTLKDILMNRTDLADSFKIRNADVLQFIYDQHSYQPLWSAKGVFTRSGDSLFAFIASSRKEGLFPNDYYYERLSSLKSRLSDTSKENKLNASLWAYSDMLLTSAFVQVTRDLKAGRLLPDSVIAKDSTLSPAFIHDILLRYPKISNDSFARSLEPQHTAFQKLRFALQGFLDSAVFKDYTLIDTANRATMKRQIFLRLSQEDSTLVDEPVPDSTDLSQAIRKWQKEKKLKADGKVSLDLVNKLNDTDKERFIRIAINLDRYKQIPPLPVKYIWVNIPSYYLQLKDSDTVVMRSRIVVGKPLTRTPQITSAISDMITYPKWTIPESIVKKEVLPGLKKDTFYTIRKGYSIVDDNGNEINPATVSWAKYKDYIPFSVVQGSGDDNALGVLKFNFPNKYSVYLHDTNQRYLFAKKNRALSHGCVRVQLWDSLAKYILRNDSAYSVNAVPVDSLESWLSAKQKRYVPVRKPIPLFIRYFTCDAGEGKLTFYEDIYGEDKRIRETIFANK
jgi:murein L,D-transpeptidase YcbB/YkuD